MPSNSPSKLSDPSCSEGTALQIDLATSQADIEQDKHIYDFASGPSGNRFVDALAVFVRPFITLVMFHLWGLIKMALFSTP
jgi:hypothetical protein